MLLNWEIKSKAKPLEAMLANRGLNPPAKQKAFFNPPHPSQLKPLSPKKAVALIKAVIKAQKLIYIYGDYDADGVCSTAILWETIHALGGKVLPYIPPRTDPTRGLSVQGIKEIVNLGEKPELIITVDNGITADEAVKYAQSLGIKVIITDHHQPAAKLPAADAIVHSLKLAGAGVSWFLAKALGQENSLDLAGLGTIADLVPLTEANRSLAKFGLEKLRTTKRPGLLLLARAAKLDLSQITARQASYNFGSRLNAMARMQQALDSVRLLCTKDEPRARKLADTLETANQNRQALTLETIIHAEKRVDKTQKLIFIADASYHEGIVGLVTGRLAEKFNRPAVVVAIGKHHAKASGRSIAGFNLIDAIRSIKADLINHGGHEQAAGFTAEVKKLSQIKTQLLQLAKLQLKGEQQASKLEIECLLDFSAITWPFYRELSRFEPFGMANPEPVFATQKVEVIEKRLVGAEKTHLKLKLKQGGKIFDAVFFGKGYLFKDLKPGQPVDVAYTIEANHFNGTKSLQLKVKDVTI